MPENSSISLNINFNDFINSLSGKPRLNRFRSYFLNNDTSLDDLVNFYRYWRDYDEYGLIHISWWEDLKLKHRYKAIKCSKRGNDVYYKRIKKRLDWIDKLPKELLNKTFFNEDDIIKGEAYTNMLFITLTYDTKKCDIKEAWQNIGNEFNDWIRKIRKKFGKVSIFRVFQAHKNGYPHIHILAYFQDYKFKVEYYDEIRDNGKCYKIYRIKEYQEFKCWHSFVDVCGVYNMKGAIKYIARYLLRHKKDEADDENQTKIDQFIKSLHAHNDLTLSLMWIFRKRSFSLSGDFRDALNDLISDLSIIKTQKILKQYSLEGVFIEKKVYYEWLGVFTPNELGIDGKKWVYEFEDMPKIKLNMLKEWD